MIKSYINPQPAAVKKSDTKVTEKKSSNLAGSEMGKTKSEKLKKMYQRTVDKH